MTHPPSKGAVKAVSDIGSPVVAHDDAEGALVCADLRASSHSENPRLPGTIKTLIPTLQKAQTLEVVFFSSIRNGGLEIVDGEGNPIDTWGQSGLAVPG